MISSSLVNSRVCKKNGLLTALLKIACVPLLPKKRCRLPEAWSDYWRNLEWFASGHLLHRRHRQKCAVCLRQIDLCFHNIQCKLRRVVGAREAPQKVSKRRTDRTVTGFLSQLGPFCHNFPPTALAKKFSWVSRSFHFANLAHYPPDTFVQYLVECDYSTKKSTVNSHLLLLQRLDLIAITEDRSSRLPAKINRREYHLPKRYDASEADWWTRPPLDLASCPLMHDRSTLSDQQRARRG